MTAVHKYDTYGETVSGAGVISQAAQMLIAIQQGEVPHFPDFGSTVADYVGAPSSVAIPNINNEIVLALQDLPDGAILKQIRAPEGYSDLQAGAYKPTALIQWNQTEVESGLF